MHSQMRNVEVVRVRAHLRIVPVLPMNSGDGLAFATVASLLFIL